MRGQQVISAGPDLKRVKHTPNRALDKKIHSCASLLVSGEVFDTPPGTVGKVFNSHPGWVRCSHILVGSPHHHAPAQYPTDVRARIIKRDVLPLHQPDDVVASEDPSSQ